MDPNAAWCCVTTDGSRAVDDNYVIYMVREVSEVRRELGD